MKMIRQPLIRRGRDTRDEFGKWHAYWSAGSKGPGLRTDVSNRPRRMQIKTSRIGSGL